jgi:hypothetical protein
MKRSDEQLNVEVGEKRGSYTEDMEIDNGFVPKKQKGEGVATNNVRMNAGLSKRPCEKQ